ncbi:uncharacterized protein (TIGR00375 family) [Thermolongibacillus altinsuensis]|uniref:Uncharacterized protein (TIGR00375 family) n=1 Tax=Thermolongibacillus altinsuensis TaxID=575256 RepID=A0A4R1QK22_9BACL|nr:endonuclease Q family protein [Thermolongibacillus altinsuensis]TCL53021.1 uncharacterized protein (TIGR00375 family) [Thermolongibacillus altinsuensis]
MNDYYVDLHIHIGRTASGKPVKITGAKTLTLSNILKEAVQRKGLQIVGIVDCHVPEILDEIERGIALKGWREEREGGIQANGVTVILGSEVEIYDEHCRGPIHVLAFFPTVERMRLFSNWLKTRVKNISLSSQRMYGTGKELQMIVKQLGGLFIPAHAFTPFKSLYGKGVHKSLTEVFEAAAIDAIELGLSADTHMADQLKELHRYPYLSNSDAHSLLNIAREYQVIRMAAPTFHELEKALKKEEDRTIVANYGLNPLLGKYYQTVCAKCLHPVQAMDERCSNCGHHQFITGVFERLQQLKTNDRDQPERPPYFYQIPLPFIPGIGPKTYQKLLLRFGTEMQVLHKASIEDLTEAIGEKLAHLIIQARRGQLAIHAGGGGQYGKIAPS